MDPRRLRQETRAEHEATEAMMPLTGESLTLATYIRTLQVLQTLIGSWEAWASVAAPSSLRSLIDRHRRAPLLARDLLHFDAEVPGSSEAVAWDEVLGAAAEKTALHREAAFVGALYVMEGSSLGGRFIARHVESVLGLVPGAGDAYFQGHGEATGTMWKEVTEAIGTVPDNLAAEAIEAAKRTFWIFGEALRSGLHAPSMVQIERV